VGGGTAGVGGGTAGGGGSAGVGGSGTAGVGGSGTSGTGGAGTAGMGGAGAAGMAGASGGGSTVEDDGLDCTVGTLPSSGSLPTITKLPDPFKKLDGNRMTTKAEWHCRREEIRRMAETYAYGTKPPKPATVSGTVSTSSITV